MKKKTIGWYLIFAIFAAAMMILFSTRTSPLYSLLLGDYSGNGASAAMLMGKYWLEGSIPYKDLFIIEGPYYLLMQALGWFLGERSGILLLQVVNYTVFMIFLWKLLKIFVNGRNAAVVTIFTSVVYIALCSGGNSDAEWCLSWIAMGCYLALKWQIESNQSKRIFLLMGIATGIVGMTQFLCTGILFGCILAMICAATKKGKVLGYALLGFIIPVLCIALYFLWVGGIRDYITAVWILPVKMIGEGFGTFNLILHKCAKCMLAFPCILAGAILCHRGKRILGEMILCSSGMTVLFLLLGDNSWKDYMVMMIPIVLAIAIFCGSLKNIVGIIIGVFTTVGICVIPLTNYVVYINEGVNEVVYEFIEDLDSFQTELKNCQVMMVDTDCSYFLKLDLKPINKYFANQTKIGSYLIDVEQEVESYENGNIEIDALITTEKGWVGQDFERFYLVQVYCKTGGNICIYTPSY